MSAPITASLLYDLAQCPRRVELDLFRDPTEREPISPFVEMLWRRGAAWEAEALAGAGADLLDLSGLAPDVREARTLEAMQARAPLIYGGRITAGDRVGVPDLLRRTGEGYLPIDIKSGRGEEGGGDEGDGKPKLHYAVQLALYVDVLRSLGLGAGLCGAIWDVRGEEVDYVLDAPRGPRNPSTLWDAYLELLGQAREIVARRTETRPASNAGCKLCHWRGVCGRELEAAGDLTLIPTLGRALRDEVSATIPNLTALASADLTPFITEDRTVFRGLGAERLRLFQLRARLLCDPSARPLLRAPVDLPTPRVDLFFDIEVDPLRDFTYLHGVLVRRGGDNSAETFHAFYADEVSPKGERDAFAQAYACLTAEPDAVIWYYSKYERTLYRKLQKAYPDVCSSDDIERLFDPARAVDLYNDVVTRATEWPTHDHSIKTLAKYLGFRWRDTDPSGAASIEWFDRWTRESDPAIRQRIIAYNEDDCRATRVLLDGIRQLAPPAATAA